MFKCFSFIFLTPFSFSLIEQPVENPKRDNFSFCIITNKSKHNPFFSILHTQTQLSFVKKGFLLQNLLFLCLGLGWPQDPSAWGNSSALRSLTAFSSNLSMRAAIAPTALGQLMYSIFTVLYFIGGKANVVGVVWAFHRL